jgi:hypothetical protein
MFLEREFVPEQNLGLAGYLKLKKMVMIKDTCGIDQRLKFRLCFKIMPNIPSINCT